MLSTQFKKNEIDVLASKVTYPGCMYKDVFELKLHLNEVVITKELQQLALKFNERWPARHCMHVYAIITFYFFPDF